MGSEDEDDEEEDDEEEDDEEDEEEDDEENDEEKDDEEEDDEEDIKERDDEVEDEVMILDDESVNEVEHPVEAKHGRGLPPAISGAAGGGRHDAEEDGVTEGQDVAAEQREVGPEDLEAMGRGKGG